MENTVKRTKRDLFNDILNGKVNQEELTNFAIKELASMDKSNANKKAKVVSAEEQAIRQELEDNILSVLTDKYMTSKEIVTAMPIETSTNKVTARLSVLVEKEVVERFTPTSRKAPYQYRLAK